ncbi:MAG: TIGR04290 family methyltransferase [Myxococcota bacterium]
MKTQLTRDDVSRRVRALGDWFQNINLGGVQTAPSHFLGDYPNCKWQRFQHAIPSDLQGKSVLDIGCNAGFYTIEFKRRGAGRTLGVDSDPRYLEQARLAAEVCSVDVEFLNLDVYELATLRERFDIVLFMGVLYHLRHPLLALDILHEHVVGDTLIFQSMLRGSLESKSYAEDYLFSESEHFEEPEYPKLHFVEQRYSHDDTNWWIPNKSCVEAMLRSAGFRIVDNPETEVYVCQRVELTRAARRSDSGLWIRTNQPRTERCP